MQTLRLMIGLTLLNVALALFTLVQQIRPALADGTPSILRGRGLEIVDARGRVRASLNVLPPTATSDGTLAEETVLLRLITERGRPSVKIGASERSAGLSFAGPTGTKNTYVILESTGTASSLRLRNEDGREQVVKP